MGLLLKSFEKEEQCDAYRDIRIGKIENRERMAPKPKMKEIDYMAVKDKIKSIPYSACHDKPERECDIGISFEEDQIKDQTENNQEPESKKKTWITGEKTASGACIGHIIQRKANPKKIRKNSYAAERISSSAYGRNPSYRAYFGREVQRQKQ